MAKASQKTANAASVESPISQCRCDYVRANDIYAALADRSGAISIEEFPTGEIVEAARRAERHANSHGGGGALVISLTSDVV